MKVWILQDLETKSVLAFDSQHLAMHAAESLVGNRSWSGDDRIMCYGDGDGATRIIIRSIPRDVARKLFPDLNIAV